MLSISSSKFVLLGLISLALKATPAQASVGDRMPIFRQCLATCTDSCFPSPAAITTEDPFLRLTRWSCKDECQYECMNLTVETEGVHQFDGKWPFTRFAGMQEPASVLFSVANGYMHLRGIRSLRRRVPCGNPLRVWYLVWGLAGINTWAWSSVFHTRDKPWTEKLDYFSAGFGITYSLFLAIIRIWHLYPTYPSNSTTWQVKCLATLFAAIFTCHVLYLTFHIPFDYGYNIIYNVLIGGGHNVLWILWSFTSLLPPFSPSRLKALFPRPYAHPNPSTPTPTHVRWPAIIGFLFFAAMAFELMDFSPIWKTFDAHSFWHLATVPIVPMWYQFLIRDANWVQRSEPKM